MNLGSRKLLYMLSRVRLKIEDIIDSYLWKSLLYPRPTKESGLNGSRNAFIGPTMIGVGFFGVMRHGLLMVDTEMPT